MIRSDRPAAVTSPSRLIAVGTTRLREAGIPEPRRESFRIFADLTGNTPAQVQLGREERVEPSVARRFARLTMRRAAGEPLPYVTGLAGFRRLVLECDRRALIPRPETEGLVDLLLARASTGVLVDLGTGTGCLALSLAQEGRFERVVAVDCSPAALALAGRNRKRLGLAIDLVRGDWGTGLAQGSADAIVSNPPYVTAAEYGELEPSVREWEPGPALLGGVDGLDATGRVLADGLRMLRPGGWLALELAAARAPAVAELARGLGWSDIAIGEDLFGRARYLTARRREA